MLKFLILVFFTFSLLMTNFKFSQVYADFDVKVEMGEAIDPLDGDLEKYFKNFSSQKNFLQKILPFFFLFIVVISYFRFYSQAFKKSPSLLFFALINLPPPSLI